MGVGLANSVLSAGHAFGEGVNWSKAQEVFTSLLVSPIVGFVFAGLLLLIAKATIHRPELYASPEGRVPPMWIRGLLMLTCTGVSFAHGSNDGQKGMGLIMLILIGILPGIYALNMDVDAAALNRLSAASQSAIVILDKRVTPGISSSNPHDELSNFLRTGKADEKTFAALSAENHRIADKLSGKTSFKALPSQERRSLRSEIYLVSKTLGKLDKQNKFPDAAEKKFLADYKQQLEGVTEFIPPWVKVAVAFALGVGTMIGWKRIVVTVGEKIGKDHLTYAQGASAELVAMGTIAAADHFGLPVSTTHVLSSGVAGTMAANRSGLQMDTLRNLLLAWVLTLPVCVLLGAASFAASLFFIFNILGLK
jgi:PiT family inorganic phosphate transporter